MTEKALEVVNRLLFANSDVTDIVGTNIHYARAPINSTFPQVIYFSVAGRDAYNVPYDGATIQVSSWSADKLQALRLHTKIREIFREYSGIVTTYLGDVNVNWTEFIEAAALPQEDAQLYGYQLRFEIRILNI